MANVFVSHRGVDAGPAAKLARELQDAGHQVWLDDWEIGIGDSIVERMQQGLDGASYLVLCYSTNSVTTPWISREWMSALARQMGGANVKLLPVVLTGGRPPAILSDIRYADLTCDWERGVNDLLRAIH
jgi:hypothetical protein